MTLFSVNWTCSSEFSNFLCECDWIREIVTFQWADGYLNLPVNSNGLTFQQDWLTQVKVLPFRDPWIPSHKLAPELFENWISKNENLIIFSDKSQKNGLKVEMVLLWNC